MTQIFPRLSPKRFVVSSNNYLYLNAEQLTGATSLGMISSVLTLKPLAITIVKKMVRQV